MIPGVELAGSLGRQLTLVTGRTGDHVVDHSLQAHGSAIVRGVQVSDTVRPESLDLPRQDRPSSPAEHDNRARAGRLQAFVEIPEELEMAPLVAGHRHGVGILGDSRIDEVSELYQKAAETIPQDAMEKLDVESAAAELE